MAAGGLNAAPTLAQANEELHSRVDPVYGFVEQECVREEGHSVEATVLYEAFKRWASDYGLEVVSQSAFGFRLREHMGLSKGRGPTGRAIYQDIRLKTLKTSPLSVQESEDEVITEDPSEGSEVDREVADVAH